MKTYVNTPASFKKQLNQIMENYEKAYVSLSAEAISYLQKINRILIDTNKPIGMIWDELSELVDEMPGFFSFWSDTRPLTLQIKTSFNNFHRNELMNSEYEIMRQQLLANEKSINNLKITVVNLEEDKKLLYDKTLVLEKLLTPDHEQVAELQIKYEMLDKQYQEKLKEIQQLERKIFSLEDENTKIKEIYTKLKTHLNELENKYDSLQNERHNEIEATVKLKNENTRIIKKLSELEERYQNNLFCTKEDLQNYVLKFLSQQGKELQLQQVSTEQQEKNKEASKESTHIVLLGLDDAEEILNHSTKNQQNEKIVMELVKIYKDLSSKNVASDNEKKLYLKIKDEYQQMLSWLMKTLQENSSKTKIVTFFYGHYANPYQLLCACYWIKHMNIAKDLNNVGKLLYSIVQTKLAKLPIIEIKENHNDLLNVYVFLKKLDKIYNDIELISAADEEDVVNNFVFIRSNQ